MLFLQAADNGRDRLLPEPLQHLASGECFYLRLKVYKLVKSKDQVKVVFLYAVSWISESTLSF
jgi:hypothetical protein